MNVIERRSESILDVNKLTPSTAIQTTSTHIQIRQLSKYNEESLTVKLDVILILSALNTKHILKTKEFSSKFYWKPERELCIYARWQPNVKYWPRMGGENISNTKLKVLHKHKLDWQHCTESVSSNTQECGKW